MNSGELDEERFTRLYRETYAAVLAYAARRSDESVARDVAAEVFLVAWRRMAELPPEPLPWLIGTARHVLANTHRRDSRQGRVVARLSDPALHAPAPDVAAAVDAERHVLAALDRLRPDDRELLTLTAWEALSVGDAARVLGCSAGAARVRLHRARRRLRLLLAEGSAHHSDQERPAAVPSGADSREASA